MRRSGEGLSAYGNLLAEYSGAGDVTTKSGTVLPCSYHAGQLSNGTNIIVCGFSDPHPDLFHSSPARFVGIANGLAAQLVADPIVDAGTLPIAAATDLNSAVVTAYTTDSLTVSHKTRDLTKRIHFGITNLEFLGTSPSARVDKSPVLTLPLRLTSPAGEIFIAIVPIPTYGPAIQRLRALRGVEVTCEAVVELLLPIDRIWIEQVEEVIEALCALLSIARGSKIQWIYQDFYTQDGQLIERLHASRVTKPYSLLTPISPRFNGAQDTKRFIETAFSLYFQRRERFRLQSGMIDTYLDAKAIVDP